MKKISTVTQGMDTWEVVIKPMAMDGTECMDPQDRKEYIELVKEFERWLLRITHSQRMRDIDEAYGRFFGSLSRGEDNGALFEALDDDCVYVSSGGGMVERIVDDETRTAAQLELEISSGSKFIGTQIRCQLLRHHIALYDMYPLIHRTDLPVHERGISARSLASLDEALESAKKTIERGESFRTLDLDKDLDHEEG